MPSSTMNSKPLPSPPPTAKPAGHRSSFTLKPGSPPARPTELNVPDSPASTSSSSSIKILGKKAISFPGISKTLDQAEKDDEKSLKGSEKVKAFFHALGSKKESSESLDSQVGKKAPSTSSEGTVVPAAEIVSTVPTKPGNLSVIPPSSPLVSGSHSSHVHLPGVVDEEFHQQVENAQKVVDRVNMIYSTLTVVAAALEFGGGWLPGVGEGCKLLADMLESTKETSMHNVAALRLVERSATIWAAVEQAIVDNKGKVSPVMQGNIDRLLTNLQDIAYLLTKLSQRSFLKLYLNARDTGQKIEHMNENLEDFVVVFQLQSTISTAAWQEQSRADHEKDSNALLERLDKARQSDQAMLAALQMKSDEQQEGIKTLQRTLDALLAIQQKEYNNEHPLSPVSVPLPQPFNTDTRLAFGTSHTRMILQQPPTATAVAPGNGGAANQVISPIARAVHYDQTIPLASPAMSLANTIETTVSDSHREFCEAALNVLRRHSADVDVAVPDWTITRLEVSHEERVNVGPFSTVWRGRWAGRQVAIKEIEGSADRQLFISEVEVWRRLRSRFILEFLGASSTTSNPPWLLVSPYMRQGNVLQYLRTDAGRGANKLAIVHQVAQGMEYLHSRDILHGDVKAANVLINDDGQAVLCDFGLSRLKLDLFRKSQKDTVAKAKSPIAGTMRWQSPERLAGGELTWECDVYGFAMAVYEICTDGQVPYGYVDDLHVRTDIQKGKRPPRPKDIPDALWALVTRCWSQAPSDRPRFDVICKTLSTMYKAPRLVDKQDTILTIDTSSSSETWVTASEGGVPEEQVAISPDARVASLPDVGEFSSSSSSSIRSDGAFVENQLSYESERAERHYRHYLQHTYDDRLTLPLWFPSVVSLGSVGYVRHGRFVKLLDATRPPLDTQDLPPQPSMQGFSILQTTRMPVNVRNAAEKGLDLVTSFISSSGRSAERAISRRIPMNLKPGMKQAMLLVDNGQFEMYNSIAEAREYLKRNIDWIIHTYGSAHWIGKEDVIIVVGTLSAHNYTMIVSNFAPRTTLTFNVHATPVVGQPWGTWSVGRDAFSPSRAFRPGFLAGSPSSARVANSVDGLMTPVDDHGLKYSCRVSEVDAASAPLHSVMLAKLRFPPGGTEPALYP